MGCNLLMGPASLWVVLGGVFIEGAFKRIYNTERDTERSRKYVERIEDLFRESPEHSLTSKIFRGHQTTYEGMNLT